MTTPNTLFRKKPVEVEAFQLPAAGVDVPDAFHEWSERVGFSNFESGRDETLLITTPEGVMEAQPGDWIICGVMGEFYPCKPEVFAATYVPAPAQPSMTIDEAFAVARSALSRPINLPGVRAVLDVLRERVDIAMAAKDVPVQPACLPMTVTEDMHVAACKVLHRAHGLDGLPQRMLDAMRAAAPVQQAADAAPTADGPPLEGLAHFHYRLQAASGYEQEGVYNNITADGFGRVIAALEGARDAGRAAHGTRAT